MPWLPRFLTGYTTTKAKLVSNTATATGDTPTATATDIQPNPLTDLLQRLLGLSSSPAVLGLETLTDSKSNLDSTATKNLHELMPFSSIA